MRRFFHPLLLSVLVIGIAELTSGCSEETKNPDVRIAEQAVGVKPEQGEQKTVQTSRDVIIEKDTKAIDAKTGEVLSEKKESTPIKVTEQKSVKTEVDVKVGETKTSTTGDPKAIPAK